MNKIFKNRIKEIITYMGFCLLITTLIVADSFLLQYIIKNAEEGDQNVFNYIFILVFGYIVLQGFGYYLQGYQMQRLIKTLSFDLREKVFSSILKSRKIDKSEEERSQEIIALTTQIEKIESKYFYSIFWGMVLFFQFILAILASLMIKPFFVIVILLMCLPSVLIPILFKKKVIFFQNKSLEAQENFISSALDYIKGGNNIILHNRESKVLEIYTDKQQAFFSSEEKNARVNANVDMYNKIASQILYLGIWLIGAYLITLNQLTLPQIVAFSQLVMLIAFPLHMVLDLLNEYYAGREVLNSINQFIETPHEENYQDDRKIKKFQSITFEGFNLKKDNKEILKDMDLHLDFEKKYLLVGESGSGKSSIANVIFNKNRSFHGNLYIDSVDISSIGHREITSQIGYFPQKNHIFNATVRDNITLFDDSYSDEQVESSMRLVGLDKYLMEKGLEEKIGENELNISGGEKQRLVLARLLIKNYDFLILDEVTSGLDSENAKIIEELLISLNIGFLIISHNYSEHFKNNVDFVINVENGKVK